MNEDKAAFNVSEQKQNVNSKENKMDGIDPASLPGLIAQLKQNGMGDEGSGYQWNNPLFWLIILGFLKGEGDGGLFGGGSSDAAGGLAAVEAAKNAGATQAKLDCLAQGQQDAAFAAHNAQMVALTHAAEMANNAGFNRLAAAMAECCCDLRSGQKDILCGQKDIVNAMCNQTQILTAQNNANTQRIVDTVNAHANQENRDKLASCERDLSNCQQTNSFNQQTALIMKEIADLKACACGDNNGGHRAEAT